MHTGRDMLRTVFLMILYFLAVLIVFVLCTVYAFKLLEYVGNETARLLILLLLFGLLIWGISALSRKVVPKILDRDYGKDDDDSVR